MTNRLHFTLNSSFVAVGVLISCFMLLLFNVILSAHVSDVGIRLSDLETKATALEKQKEFLNYQKYSQSSLTNLKAKAPELGFTTDIDFVTLSASLPVAFKP